MITVKIDIELVESMLSAHTQYTGSVLLQEIQTTMETFIKNGLERGCTVSLREAFDNAWAELILLEASEESMSDEDAAF